MEMKIHVRIVAIVRRTVYNYFDILFRKGGWIMDYMSCAEAAAKWGISERRVQKLCEGNRIPGVSKFGSMWMIPKEASKPVDGRTKRRGEGFV
jgi:hypothetical protein